MKNKELWIGARCSKRIKQLSANTWKELCGYSLSDVYSRHLNGLGYANLYDQSVSKALQKLIGKIRIFKPAIAHATFGSFVDDFLDKIEAWRQSLIEEQRKLAVGRSAIYYDEVVHDILQKDGDGVEYCPRLTLQAALNSTGFQELSPDGLAWEIRKLFQVYKANKNKESSPISDCKSSFEYWKKIGTLIYADRYNIRVEACDRKSDSESIRNTLEFVYDVPNISTKDRLLQIQHDIKILDTYSGWKKEFKEKLESVKEEHKYLQYHKKFAEEDQKRLEADYSKMETLPPLEEEVEKEDKKEPSTEENE